MDLKFDSYSLRARLLPAYLAVAPVLLLISATVPDGLKLPLGATAAVVFVPISYFLGQIAADAGKKLEQEMWRSWGGPPTTRFLRHGNPEFNAATRSRVHAKLLAIGMSVPTAEEQKNDAHEADVRFDACTQELIRRTRDTSRFPLVFKALTEYGFRRNLLGVRPVGLSLSLVSFAGATLSTWAEWDLKNPPAIPIVATVATGALTFAWFQWCRKRSPKMAANRYARFMLEAALDQ